MSLFLSSGAFVGGNLINAPLTNKPSIGKLVHKNSTCPSISSGVRTSSIRTSCVIN
jgi:hypothetical protein